MIGMGTIINVVAIIAGGLLGRVCGRFLSARYQDTLNMVCGVSVLFLGIAGALEGMLTVEGSSVVSGNSGCNFAGYRDAFGKIYRACNDRGSIGKFVPNWFRFNLLRGLKSGLG